MNYEWRPWIDRLSRAVCYFKATGTFVWLEKPGDTRENRRWNTRYAGTAAFNSLTRRGYLCGRFEGKTALTHRVVWALETGKMPATGIDHINGCIVDNRFSNLRAVNQSLNAKNARMRTDNTSGVTGVVRSGRKWVARINVDGKRIHLGTFDRFSAAVAARKDEQANHAFTERHGQ